MTPEDRMRLAKLESAVETLRADLDAVMDYQHGSEGGLIEDEMRIFRACQMILAFMPKTSKKSRSAATIARTLLYFIDHAGTVVSRDRLYQLVVKDPAREVGAKIVDVRICHLREVLGWLGFQHGDLYTISGLGYLMPQDIADQLTEMLRQFERPGKAA